MTNQNILIVSVAKLDNVVIETISKQTGLKCTELYKYNRPIPTSDLKRHKDCIYLAFKTVLIRKEYSRIIFWQQFIGLYYSLLGSILFVRKFPKAIILTVIYIKRKGSVGIVYSRFFKKAFRSRLIDKMICHSSSERIYYLTEFGHDLKDKIVFCKLGEGIVSKYLTPTNGEKYFFSGGASNRDYDTLIKAFDGLDEHLIIACKIENIDARKIPSNVKIIHNAYGEDFQNLMKNAYSVILPIADPNISAGQLVLLNAMRFGKSAIVTSGNCMADYIDKAYVLEVKVKSAKEIREAVNMLSRNPELNQNMSMNAYSFYANYYSIEKYAQNIAKLV